MDIALIVGSLRKESYTRRIAHAITSLAPRSLSFSDVPIGALPLYNQDLDPASPPREWIEFRDRMRGMDGVLFATPEYNRSVPGVLKNALDVGSRPYGKSIWQHKPCAIVSVSPGQYGAFGANHHLRQSLVFLDMPCMQQPEAYVANVGKSWDENGRLVDKTAAMLKTFAESFEQWVTRFAGKRAHDSAA